VFDRAARRTGLVGPRHFVATSSWAHDISWFAGFRRPRMPGRCITWPRIHRANASHQGACRTWYTSCKGRQHASRRPCHFACGIVRGGSHLQRDEHTPGRRGRSDGPGHEPLCRRRGRGICGVVRRSRATPAGVPATPDGFGPSRRRSVAGDLPAHARGSRRVRVWAASLAVGVRDRTELLHQSCAFGTGSMGTAEQDGIARQVAEAVERALQGMTAARREAFVMLRYEGLSVAMAAQIAGVSEGALKIRAFHAYEIIRSALAAQSQPCNSEESGSRRGERAGRVSRCCESQPAQRAGCPASSCGCGWCSA
jgi:sigma-70-like protein